MLKKEEIQQAAHESLCGDKSYVSSYEENGFVKGAEWAEKVALDKMCNFLKNCQRFVVETPQFSYFDYKKAIESLKQSMNE